MYCGDYYDSTRSGIAQGAGDECERTVNKVLPAALQALFIPLWIDPFHLVERLNGTEMCDWFERGAYCIGIGRFPLTEELFLPRKPRVQLFCPRR